MREYGLAAVQTKLSSACDSASSPVAAITSGGAVRTSSGSSSVAAKRAFGSPQAILRWSSSREMTAKDWDSLPVPAVQGTPTDGSIGFEALPNPQ